uniref:U1-type domain-containing protein n=1 Tax=Romanomermis culicivorax TaxID=13658 RepID=A0A915I1T0_ROMCU
MEVVHLSDDQDDSNSGYDTDKERLQSRDQGPEKKKKRVSICKKETRKYLKEWEDWPELKAWLAPVAKKLNKAWCKYCKCQLTAHSADLKSHAKTEKHQKAVKEAVVTSSFSITHHVNIKPSEERKIAELKIATFIADSSIPFRPLDLLIDLMKLIFKKSEVARNLPDQLTNGNSTHHHMDQLATASPRITDHTDQLTSATTLILDTTPRVRTLRKTIGPLTACPHLYLTLTDMPHKPQQHKEDEALFRRTVNQIPNTKSQQCQPGQLLSVLPCHILDKQNKCSSTLKLYQ